MSKLTHTHLAILKALHTQDGPAPVDKLSGLPISGAALDAHLDHLASRGFLSRTGKAIALTEIGQAALSEAPTKKARMITLLTAEAGVTVPELAATLDWLPHTTRAALTGLKEAGYTIDKLPPLEGSRSSRYKLVEVA